MRRILMTTAAIGALAFSAAGAMAQTPPPVPNASGSQVTNPATYGNTASPGTIQTAPPGQPAMTGTCAPVPNASGSQTTNPCTYGSTVPQNHGQRLNVAPSATGSVPPPPVPNASGSQVTNPATYGNTTPVR
ncbi:MULTISPECIES: hypothetical protein [Microvirga]|uniref:hypothetical protein n=1 Tax=Microvirga TaxID=186650 RepID=UPI001CFFA19A|nr:hypothetical protein [Microvirga lenta]MCB5174819.1 hypothetical protein [Microvirga lenta]